jgi:hypothetical protein
MTMSQPNINSAGDVVELCAQAAAHCFEQNRVVAGEVCLQYASIFAMQQFSTTGQPDWLRAAVSFAGVKA